MIYSKIDIPPSAGGLKTRQAHAAPIKQPCTADRLKDEWTIRRRNALGAVSRAIREHRLEGAEAMQLAQIVHNVAGIAGIFGEGDLGVRASALERALRHGGAAERFALATEFLRAA